MRRATRIGVVGVSVALFALGGAGLFRSVSTEPGAPPAAPTSRVLLAAPVVGQGSVARAIEALQDRVRALPLDWRSYASLGLAYVQQARITADPGFYPKAEGVLRRSLVINDGDNFEAMVGMGALDLARHRFGEALRWGRRAAAVNPYNGGVYGVIGDAQVELGRYRQAFETFQTMVDRRPDIASYARISYARELQGDVRGAVRAMVAAVGAAGTPEDAAWASFQMGELYFTSGQLSKAARAYRRGVELAPRYVPPHAGLAKVAWARGRFERAIGGLRWVARRYPSPEYVIALGDLYTMTGRFNLAERAYALVRAEQRLFRSNGVNVDLELALFDADHGSPEEALRAARAEWGRRHSIHVADALAWALYANGRYGRAAPYARRALALGTRNALFMFHAGMIRLRLGDEAAARRLLSEAVRTNPHFSILYAPVAEHTLARLEGGT